MDTMYTICVHCTQFTAIVHSKHKLCTLCTLGTVNVHCDQWTYIVSNVTLCPLCTINVHCDQWTFIVSIVFIVSIIPIMLIGRNQPKCNLQPIDASGGTSRHKINLYLKLKMQEKNWTNYTLVF